MTKPGTRPKIVKPVTGKQTHRARWIVIDSIRIIDNGYIECENGTITAIGKGKPKDPFIDHGPGLLMPPLVNTHLHLELSALKKRLPFNEGFRSWVKQLLEKRARLSEKQLLAASQSAVQDLLEWGNLYIGEISTLGITRDSIKHSGLHGIWFQEYLGSQSDDFQSVQGDLFCYSLAGHAPHSTSPLLLKKLKKVARSNNLPFSIHLAESEDESEFINTGQGQWADFLASRNIDCSSWETGSKSPVEYINELGLLDPLTIAVHALNVIDTDLEILADSKTQVCLCPRSNYNLHGKLPKIEQMLKKGIHPCLGTDSLASCDSLNIFDEMKFINENYPELDPANIFSMATMNGAHALGFSNKTGSIEPGKRAEFLYLPTLITQEKNFFEEMICNE